MNKKMNKSVLLIILAGVIVLGIAIVAIVWQGNSPAASGVFDDFAKCLTEKNIVMYGTNSCSWCRKQKEDLGNSFQYVNYVECSVETQKCIDQKIQGTPTWIWPDGKRIEKYLTLEELSQESSCPLPEGFSVK